VQLQEMLRSMFHRSGEVPVSAQAPALPSHNLSFLKPAKQQGPSAQMCIRDSLFYARDAENSTLLTSESWLSLIHI